MEVVRQQLNNLGEEEKRKLLAQMLRKKKTSIRILPLSFAQQRLWFLDQLISDNPAYNIPVALKLSGSLNVTALEQSLKQLIQRHESLRTTFTIKDGNPVQVIGSETPLNLAIINLQHLPENEIDKEAGRLISLEAKKPFDLGRGPLIRILLFCLANEEHILFLNLHHIIADGWSLGVFNRELSLLYDANCSNKPFPLPELPIQYADFAVWQREWLQGEVLESHLSYWKNHLSGLVPLELASDRIRPPIQTFRGDVVSVEIPEELLLRLKVFSKQEDVTLYMSLLAAFGTLLYRYSHSTKIAIGSPIANRNRREIEGLIGFFVNTVVMNINFSGNPTFRELLQRVREVTKGAYAHQDLPFEKLVDELQPERDLTRNPLVQILFALQNAPMEALKLNHLTVTPLKYEFEYTRFDLELHLWEDSKIGISPTQTATGLSGNLFYNADIFDRETIIRLGKHFLTLLQNVLVNPEQSLWQIQIVSAAEQQILVGNSSALETQTCCLQQLFEKQVNQISDTTALVFGDQQWTYQKLNEQANQLAHYLLVQGAKPETRIGIFLERSANMVTTILGILKAGSAYVCLDTKYPQERLRYMLTNSELDILVTQRQLLERLPISDVKICCLEDEQDNIARQSPENPPVRGTLDNLLYIVYTSGSTGQPKGIAMSHRSLANLIATQAQSLVSPAKTLQFASPSFDVASQEILLTFCTGGTLYLISNEIRQQPSALLEFLMQQKIERLFLPFAFLEQLAFTANESQLTPSCLREIITAGEQLKISPPLQQFFERLEQSTLINQYGPAETHVVTEYKLRQPASQWSALPPIGRPIPNTQVYILDSQLQVVPPGSTGEVYVGGVALARGYVNRPADTAEKFIPDPLGNQPGGRLYKTGDCARYRPDGTIEYIGRIDEQIKVRGYRIEPGEIEVILNTHSGVRECVVAATEGNASEKRLVAYLIPDTQKPTANDLRDYLKKLLPDYMVPSCFLLVDKIPLSPNGKVDQKALSQLKPTEKIQQEDFVIPRTQEEQIIASVWQEVLKLERVGIHDNFFDLGGNSLLIVQVQRKLSARLYKEITVTDLFQYPTIYHLGNYVGRRKTGEISLPPSLGDRAGKQKIAFSQKAKDVRKKNDGRL